MTSTPADLLVPIKPRSNRKVLMQLSHLLVSFPAFRQTTPPGVVRGRIRGESGLEMEYVLGGSDCPSTVYLFPSSEVCNHEVNQHDTGTSIIQTPFGVTCLLQEKAEKSCIYISKNGSGNEVDCSSSFLLQAAQCKLQLRCIYHF